MSLKYKVGNILSNETKIGELNVMDSPYLIKDEKGNVMFDENGFPMVNFEDIFGFEKCTYTFINSKDEDKKKLK
jgi:hypothetical protein